MDHGKGLHIESRVRSCDQERNRDVEKSHVIGYDKVQERSGKLSKQGIS